jgi:hypothetical protein
MPADAAMLYCSSLIAWEDQMAANRHVSYAGAGCHAPVGSGLRLPDITLAAVLASAVLIAPSPVESHDIYVGVYTRQGVPCCDESDCVAAPFRVTPDGVEMLVRGVWISVPRWYIQYRALPGDTTPHRSHWCGALHLVPTDGVNTMTRCAILPPHAL